MKIKLALAIMIGAVAIASADEPQLFKPLTNPDKKILMTNAEFSSQFGRKLIFKDVDSGARKAFDVMAVNQDVLTVLHIDSAAAISAQNKIDEQKRAAAESYAQQAAIIRAQQKVAAEEAAKLAVQQAKQAKIDAEIAEEKRKEDEEHNLKMRIGEAQVNESRAAAQYDRASAGYLNRSP